jgi:hypothetical protein
LIKCQDKAIRPYPKWRGCTHHKAQYKHDHESNESKEMYITKGGRGVFLCLLLKIVRDQKEGVKSKNPLVFRKGNSEIQGVFQMH